MTSVIQEDPDLFWDLVTWQGYQWSQARQQEEGWL